MKPSGQATVRDEYQRALVTLGQIVRVERAHDVIVGLAESVDEYGQLQVRTEDELLTISVGDVVHVRPHEGATS